MNIGKKLYKTFETAHGTVYIEPQDLKLLQSRFADLKFAKFENFSITEDSQIAFFRFACDLIEKPVSLFIENIENIFDEKEILILELIKTIKLLPPHEYEVLDAWYGFSGPKDSQKKFYKLFELYQDSLSIIVENLLIKLRKNKDFLISYKLKSLEEEYSRLISIQTLKKNMQKKVS